MPVSYVADLDRFVAFYRLFGFEEQSSGGDGPSRWCYLRSGEQYLLLADVRPPLPTAELPLSFYFYVADLPALTRRLTAAGIAVEDTGRPEHAQGGEARLTDPDGNTILIGQRTPAAGSPGTGTETGGDKAADGPGGAGDGGEEGSGRRFSLLHEAAEQIRRRGGAPAQCQIGEPGGRPCPRPAEVKLADSWGETAWACLTHADETLIGARGAFLATQDDQGLQQFLLARQAGG